MTAIGGSPSIRALMIARPTARPPPHRSGHGCRVGAGGVPLRELLGLNSRQTRRASTIDVQLPHLRRPLGRVIAREEATEGDDEADDLLLADLHRSPEAVMRWAGEDARCEVAVAPCPRLRIDIHILMLQGDGFDEVRAPDEDARCLRPANRLAATEGDEVRPDGNQGAQVFHRRQGGGAHPQ